MNIALIIFLTIFGIVFAAYGILYVYEKILFEYDPDNQYRRVCTECGQVQEQFGEYYNLKKKGYWDPIGPTLDPECPCNFFTKSNRYHFE